MPESVGTFELESADLEAWVELAARQQDVLSQLRELIYDQRRLAADWHDAGAVALAATAREIESALRTIASRLLELEHSAVDEIADIVSDAVNQMRLA